MEPLGSVTLDRSLGSVYRQIEARLAHAIEIGDLAPDTRLPAERDLAADLGVSRMTLRQALAALERRGLVVRTVGRTGGTFVAGPKFERDLSTNTGLSAQLTLQGYAPGAHLLSATVATASEAVAAALHSASGAAAYEIVRIRLADGAPVALEYTYLPATEYPGILEHPLHGSLYELMRDIYGSVPYRAVERLEATVAGAEEAALLNVSEGSPLMLVERTAYGDSEKPLEFSREFYRADRMRVVVHIDGLGTPAEKRSSLGR